MDHARRLLATGAQARDVITARNLPLIDGYDTGRSGRHRPFGTEGQSLIFDAYDLNSRALIQMGVPPALPGWQ